MLSLCNLLFINLWQTIDIIMIALNTEVLCEVDDLDVPWDGVLLEECLALAMTKTEEYDIHLIERHLVGELQVSLTDESFVYVADEIASVTLGVGKDNLCLRMVEQQADQFSACIACST